MAVGKPLQHTLQMNAAEKKTLQNCLRNLRALEGCRAEFEPLWDNTGSCGNLSLETRW